MMRILLYGIIFLNIVNIWASPPNNMSSNIIKNFTRSIQDNHSININIKTSSIDSFADLFPFLERINLPTTAFIIDFDETTVRTIVKDNDWQEYRLIGTPDFERTYGEDFKKALPGERTMDDFKNLRSEVLAFERYELLDTSLRDLWRHYSTQFAYTAVLSGLKEERTKTNFLKGHLGNIKFLTAYGRKEGKAGVLVNELPSHINTVVFIDNNLNEIEKFSKNIKESLEKKEKIDPFELKSIEVHAFHFKKFENELRDDNGKMLKEELSTLFNRFGEYVNESDDESDDNL